MLTEASPIGVPVLSETVIVTVTGVAAAAGRRRTGAGAGAVCVGWLGWRCGFGVWAASGAPSNVLRSHDSGIMMRIPRL
jgi:hypothetical protein